jgi:23S rRNA (cytidine1920-2'-O)/16S rRNA (cytidine1409-2'-O)-methyltransferase
VRQPALHRQVVSEVERFCRDQTLAVGGVVESLLLGPKGNREFFILAVKPTP